MDALHLLTTRRSSKKLTAPAPNAEQLEAMLQAATQVPDHGNMRPFRFTVIQSAEGLQRFREILCRTVTELNFGDDVMRKAERVGSMAPMVIGVTFAPNREVAKPKPEWEQMLSAGCAAYGVTACRFRAGLRQRVDYGNVGQQPALARSIRLFG